MDLKQYEQKKFAVAKVIRSAQAIDTKDGTLRSECRDLLARLAEDRFNLLVVGRFSRGKSTLMNAILGGDHLPTGIVPLTSAITTVRYGSRKQVVLNFSDFGLRSEIPLARLAEYVTQKENPGNVKKLAYAEIELPVEILRRGLFFVDTPGLGSPIIENTLTTERFLPEADAFVLVTSYESPLSEEEDRILHRIRNTNKKLFIVINKQDTVGPEERNEAIDFVRERLERFSFPDTAKIFSISARQGLEAKQTQNQKQLEASGIQALEAELLRFLTEERAQSFLVNTYKRTMTFLIQRSRAQEHPEYEVPYKRLIEQFRDLREMVLGMPNQPENATAAGENADVDSHALQLNQKTGCNICGAILEAILRFLRGYQYELTIDPETQQEHARRGGFCSLHTWQYETISSPYGVCVAYPELVHRLAAELKGFAGEMGRHVESMENIRGLLPTAKTCRVCEVRIDAGKKAVKDTAEIALHATASDANVPACCLAHLIMTVEALGPGEPARRLLDLHADLLERTAEDLQRYALKHDALRRYLTSEEERQASQLALLLLAGHRNVSGPWVVEYI
ncbi:MAG: dynamin family protein [Acidobacteriaceae bacterium]